MDTFVGHSPAIPLVLLVAVRTRVVARARLLHCTLIVVVVVLLPTQDQLVALSQQCTWSTSNLTLSVPASQQVRRLPNRSDHLLC